MSWENCPFPPIKLESSERHELIQAAESLIDEALTANAELLRNTDQRPNPVQWKALRDREGLRVYVNRQHTDGGPYKHVHQLVGVGLLDASFDDFAYAVSNHTTEAMYMQSAYMNDVFTNGAVLATVQLPTREHLFQSTTLRWSAKDLPLHLRVFSRHQDSVYLNATGTRILATGEAIGYNLMPSIDHIGAPPLPQYERRQISAVTLWREVKPDHVQVVTRAYVILRDNFLESATIKAIANAMLSVWKVGQCAQYKKLTWLVKNPKTLPLEYQRHMRTGSGCGVCGEALSESRRRSNLACVVCSQPTCKACRILIDLILGSTGNQPEDSRRRVCVACVVNAKRIEAGMIAQNEAIVAQQLPCVLQPLD